MSETTRLINVHRQIRSATKCVGVDSYKSHYFLFQLLPLFIVVIHSRSYPVLSHVSLHFVDMACPYPFRARGELFAGSNVAFHRAIVLEPCLKIYATAVKLTICPVAMVTRPPEVCNPRRLVDFSFLIFRETEDASSQTAWKDGVPSCHAIWETASSDWRNIRNEQSTSRRGWQTSGGRVNTATGHIVSFTVVA